jgi:hypothetical protein
MRDKKGLKMNADDGLLPAGSMGLFGGEEGRRPSEGVGWRVI